MSARLELVGKELESWASSPLIRSNDDFPDPSKTGKLDTDPFSIGDLEGLVVSTFGKNLALGPSFESCEMGMGVASTF